MEKNFKNKIDYDLSRDVWCLFGLPVDNLTLESTKKLIRARRSEQGPAVLSTINVNWVVSSFNDPKFRSSITNSDIVVIDGKPLLWLSKLLGFPMQEVVAGSTLTQELLEDTTTKDPLTIFLFGGEDGIAEKAMAEINRKNGGLKAVGAYNPGFTTVEEMSTDSTIEIINETSPDILLVALGAKKGMQWIEKNRHRLNAKIVSHLGATINFLAGNVKRAPVIWRNAGVEWLWRILQEPALFKRYAFDGYTLAIEVVKYFPQWRKYKSFLRLNLPKDTIATAQIQDVGQDIWIFFGTSLHAGDEEELRKIFADALSKDKDLILDFGSTEFIEGKVAALLLLVFEAMVQQKKSLRAINMRLDLYKQLSMLGVNRVFEDVEL